MKKWLNTGKQKDRETEERINGEIDACGMACKIKDSEGNRFAFGGIENGLPWYRTSGGSTHITDLTGFDVIEKYISL